MSLLLAAGCAHAPPALESNTNAPPPAAHAEHRRNVAPEDEPRRAPDTPRDETYEFEDIPGFDRDECLNCGMG